ncbi:hypothetical protein Ab1vBOLIVR5_gp193 [Agrobacterium phage OLIVR5]|uniref:Uncharacterized protein n=3 Tax=Caudoviricetes TaxID=2731619 RepID=A0A858MTU3_9CAUD|nr:hypothetical protein KNU99_gp208 [Agrobacterium phage OLIVR5]QIW87841.1 hypothetical protein Ab1vBOLIVR5_gp193 [Agrobacterium phage OLIVR5]QIW88106.1 hypothetical protein Ab1vBOLIVR6_gp199 [Agrobacterium phage OLIVR6]
MISHKLTEIGAICFLGAGYCAREYELISPMTFKYVTASVSVVAIVLLWSLFFEPGTKEKGAIQ